MMSSLSRFIHLETHYGQAIQSGEATITPVSRALVVAVGPLGGVWNRPSAVIVEQGNTRETIPIIDRSGLALAGLAALMVVVTTYSMLRRRK
jgi:uncharacterized spore protein YtfJ